MKYSVMDAYFFKSEEIPVRQYPFKKIEYLTIAVNVRFDMQIVNKDGKNIWRLKKVFRNTIGETITPLPPKKGKKWQAQLKFLETKFPKIFFLIFLEGLLGIDTEIVHC